MNDPKTLMRRLPESGPVQQAFSGFPEVSDHKAKIVAFELPLSDDPYPVGTELVVQVRVRWNGDGTLKSVESSEQGRFDTHLGQVFHPVELPEILEVVRP